MDQEKAVASKAFGPLLKDGPQNYYWALARRFLGDTRQLDGRRRQV